MLGLLKQIDQTFLKIQNIFSYFVDIKYLL